VENAIVFQKILILEKSEMLLSAYDWYEGTKVIIHGYSNTLLRSRRIS
jgi:hypothetical protein